MEPPEVSALPVVKCPDPTQLTTSLATISTFPGPSWAFVDRLTSKVTKAFDRRPPQGFDPLASRISQDILIWDDFRCSPPWALALVERLGVEWSQAPKWPRQPQGLPPGLTFFVEPDSQWSLRTMYVRPGLWPDYSVVIPPRLTTPCSG
jgi:hypothetical protein